MPAYIPITELETDPNKPLTSELAKKWRDNPLAIAEGAVGAPYVKTIWHPYNSLVVGGATGSFWNFAIDGAVSSVTTPDFEDGFEYRLRGVNVGVSGGGGPPPFLFEAYQETTAAFTSPVTLFSINPASPTDFEIVINTPRKDKPGILLTGHNAQNAVSAGVAYAARQKCLRIRFSTSGASLNSGEIFLDRRLIYA